MCHSMFHEHVGWTSKKAAKQVRAPAWSCSTPSVNKRMLRALFNTKRIVQHQAYVSPVAAGQGCTILKVRTRRSTLTAGISKSGESDTSIITTMLASKMLAALLAPMPHVSLVMLQLQKHLQLLSARAACWQARHVRQA